MAKLIVSDGFQFDPGDFQNEFQGLNGTTVKTEDDVWRITESGGSEAFVRGHNFTYDNNDTPNDISDDIISSGDITSFSFNEPGAVVGEVGRALLRIRDLNDLSGAKVHDALQSGTADAAFSVLHTAFKGDDILKGGNLGDVLFGFHGSDDIRGHGGGDELVGGSGKDTLDGGGGSDELIGGSGKDEMYGGGGADQDVFLFENADSGKSTGSADRIYEFHSGEDTIDLSLTGGNKSMVDIEHHKGEGHGLEGDYSKITLAAHDSADKMLILVMDNDHVTKADLNFMMFAP